MTEIERKKRNKAYRSAYYKEHELSTNSLYAKEEKKGTKWTCEELQFLVENISMSRLELSKALGRTCISIRNQQQRLGLLNTT